jgi:tetratricopeptide (TPR) repeat protein
LLEDIDTKHELFYNTFEQLFCVFIDILSVEKMEAGMAPEQLPSKIGKSVGEKLRAARVAHNYTQGRLAAPDFSVSYISAIERGQIHPSLRALEILAGRLGLSSTQLLPNRAQHEDRTAVSLNNSERDEDEIELLLLEAQTLIRKDASVEAITILEKMPTKRLKRPQLLQHHYLLGWAYLQEQRIQESEQILAEAAPIAKELNDTYLNLKIQYLRGLVYGEMHNSSQALLYYQRCISLLEETKPRDFFFLAQVYQQMGQQHAYQEEFEQSLIMYNNAISLISRLIEPQEIKAFYWEFSQNYAETKAFDLAKLYVYKCLYLNDMERSRKLKSELQHYLGRAYMQGDHEQAGAYLDNALQQESVIQDPLSLASVSIHKAEWHIARKELDAAEIYAQQALHLVESQGDSIIAAEVFLTLGRIEYAAAKFDESDKHFVTGLNIMERVGSQEQLAEQSVQYAQLLEERGLAQEAFIYFKRAFQSGQKAGK